MSEAAHNSAIVDQFTRQAEVFNVAPSLTQRAGAAEHRRRDAGGA